MRLQINTTLALYSVIEFATDPERHIPAAEIADKYGVSPHHLAKVLAELARAGIVESVRGVRRRLPLHRQRAPPDADGRDPAVRGFRPAAPGATTATPTPVDQALDTVLSEIDQIAKATFSSITLATMLQLVARQQAGSDGLARAAP